MEKIAIKVKFRYNFSQPNTFCDEKGLRHSVDYPGQLSSLSVVPVVIEELADGDDDQATEDATNYLQDYFSLSCSLRPGTQHTGAHLQQLKQKYDNYIETEYLQSVLNRRS